MKRDIPLKLLYVLAPLLVVAIFLIDSFLYLVRFDISLIVFSLKNLREILILLFIVAWYFILRRKFLPERWSIAQRLGRLALLLTVNYVVIFLLDRLLDPLYMEGAYENFQAVVYANLVGLLGILTLTPTMLILRTLIFYKQRRTTRLYFNLFLVLLFLTSLRVYMVGEPPGFELGNADTFSAILSILLLISTVLLAFRTDWITYLPRKQKWIYFAVGTVLVVQVVMLWDTVYTPHLSAYSLAVANLVNLLWIFLMVYSFFALGTLLVHLPTAKAVDRKLREVESLNEFARMMNSEMNFTRLTQLITQLTARVLGSHCAWLELYEPEENRLRVVSHINLSQQQILQNPFDDPEGFNRMIIEEKKPVLINDIPQHPELKHLGNWHQQVRSMLATPLFSNRGQLMGILYAAKSQSYGFDIDDVSLMEGFANQTAIALENAKLWQTSIEKERLEQELKVAREVQLRLVPQEMPRVGGFEIDSYFLTAYEVGGDYYDFIQFSDNLPGVVIGDVSGKGTSAAFYMAEFKGVIQTLAHTSRDPGKLLCRANRIFYPTIERHSFVTAIVGKLIPDRNRFRFARAGHTPVLHCSPARGLVTFLQPPGLGIGLDRGPLFEKIIRVEEVELAPGDTLLLFTDGLIELRNAGGEEYGEERLAAMVQECHELSAEALKDRILNDIMDFSEGTPLHDDLTLVIIKRIDRTEVPEKTEEAAAVEPETVA